MLILAYIFFWQLRLVTLFWSYLHGEGALQIFNYYFYTTIINIIR